VVFAPEIHCELMELTRKSYNSIGLPTNSSRYVVTRLVAGEPPPEAFVLPAGYRAEVRSGFSR